MKKSVLSLALVSCFSSASGLLMQEAVYANSGAGGAGDGVYTKSAAAIFTNPAIMSHMGESLTTVNTLLLDLELAYSDESQASGNSTTNTKMPVLGAFFARQVSENIHTGLALNVTGGSGVDYGSDWSGASYLESAFLSAVQINPSLSYRLNEHLSVGAGIQFGYALLTAETSALEVSDLATDTGWGYNIGAVYHMDKWAAGLSYRSQVDFDFDTTAKVKSGPLTNGPTGELTSSLLTPAIVDLSGSYMLTNKLALLGTIQWHDWSKMNETPLALSGDNRSLEGVITRDWEDVWRYSVGTEYQLSDDWYLKAGFSYETSPQDDPEKQWVDLPVGEAYRYSVGASYAFDDMTLDVFYEYADLGIVDIDNVVQGSFDGKIHFVGVNFVL